MMAVRKLTVFTQNWLCNMANGRKSLNQRFADVQYSIVLKCARSVDLGHVAASAPDAASVPAAAPAPATAPAAAAAKILAAAPDQ
jgi:hypothetical protein